VKLLSCLLILPSLLLPVALHAQTSGSGGEGVDVGTSDLISTLQYSDTFTFGSGSSGTRNGSSYDAQQYPLPGNVGDVENDYGHPAQSWGNNAFSIANDANFYGASGNNPYPGSSGAGSATGFTQTGLTGDQPNSETDFGIGYGLSNNFVVQVDAVQVNDRIDINIGNTNNTIQSSDGLSVFFRAGSIGIYNDIVHETVTPFTLTGLTDDTWNNYAVDFNLTAKTLSIYTNENLIGVVNLNTFDGGAYAGILDASSNAFVGVGGAEPTNSPDSSSIGLLWTDNFEVGTPVAVPEPSTYAMLLGGAALLFGFVGLRRANA
jgi:hypothetical protein